MSIFSSADILFPASVSLEQWAVIACDQFASEPEYWQQTRRITQGVPSALNLIWPEAELNDDAARRIAAINETMHDYLNKGLFHIYTDAFIYVERTLRSGQIRRGIVGALDLQSYDYHPHSRLRVHATERTVVERIPPRVSIRKDAPLELTHVLLLCDDPESIIFGSIQKDDLPVIYDFDLMQGGGHIKGWLLQGPNAVPLRSAIAKYEAAAGPVAYAVGDGNHSLATAKTCYDMHRTELARYALVELENIHDDAQQFEPIHRLVKHTDPQALLDALKPLCAHDGYPIPWYSGSRQGTIYLQLEIGQLSVGALQNFLDKYLENHHGEIDYIHGQNSLRQLSAQPDAIGFLLPAMEKSQLFPGIMADGVLPRKTFSMGHAQEKRYYLEAKLIK